MPPKAVENETKEEEYMAMRRDQFLNYMWLRYDSSAEAAAAAWEAALSDDAVRKSTDQQNRVIVFVKL